MKTISICLFFLAITFSTNCKKQSDSISKNPVELPACISSKIEHFKNEMKHDPPVAIYRYRYHKAVVYYITSYCCDIPSELYDESCNLLCNPDGGFIGTGDGRCTDFFSDRKDQILIWKDNR